MVDHWAYMIFFWIIYTYLLLNDSIKLYFLPKMADYPINALTFICLLYFIIDMIIRCFTEKRYFPWFYFWVDIADIFFIASSAIIQSISLWITLSFLKILMVLKIAKLIQTYKEWRWARKIKKKIKQEKLNKKASN